MSQKQYDLLYWVTLICSLIAISLGLTINGSALFICSCIILVGGDIARKLEMKNEPTN